MFRYWKEDPKSVHPSWAAYFSGLDKGLPSSSAFSPAPGIGGVVPQPADGSPKMDLEGGGDVTDYLKVQLLIRAYQVRGHTMADLDPLGILNADLDSHIPPELKLDYYGWTESDLSKEFNIKSVFPRFLSAYPEGKMTLGQIVDELKKIYSESDIAFVLYMCITHHRHPHRCSVRPHHRPWTV